jgi:serine/threonine-protein kinase
MLTRAAEAGSAGAVAGGSPGAVAGGSAGAVAGGSDGAVAGGSDGAAGDGAGKGATSTADASSDVGIVPSGFATGRVAVTSGALEPSVWIW